MEHRFLAFRREALKPRRAAGDIKMARETIKIENAGQRGGSEERRRPLHGFGAAGVAMDAYGAAFDAFGHWAKDAFFGAASPATPAAGGEATWHVTAREPESGFESGEFECSLGELEYRLWVPKKAQDLINAGKKPAVIVFLHGCKQTADSFADGARAREQAENGGFIALCPQQSPKENGWRCWNWFRRENQSRSGGEAALIAFLAHCAQERFLADPRKMGVMGLSAGGAMSIALSTLFPDIFSVAASHSGLPFGAAQDLQGALGAMRGGVARAAVSPQVPVIVFQGTQDKTVDPINGERSLRRGLDERPASKSEKRINGRLVNVERFDAHAELPRAELWTIEGAGHAWSGGVEGAGYTDVLGPDATVEALKFFEKIWKEKSSEKIPQISDKSVKTNDGDAPKRH